MNNYILGPVDTDSISICKPDMTPFTLEEQEKILEEMNKLYGGYIKWKHDGIYPTVIVLKAKNYVLYDGKKIKIKGSALRASTKCPALKEFIKELIDYILQDKTNYQELYFKYVKEIMSIKDISRWSSRITITDKIFKNERTNETKKRQALEGSEYVEGDRCYMFYKSDDTMCLVENFNGDYHVDRLLENLYDTVQIFSPILDMSLFPNFKLKKNKVLLQEIIK